MQTGTIPDRYGGMERTSGGAVPAAGTTRTGDTSAGTTATPTRTGATGRTASPGRLPTGSATAARGDR